MAKKREIKEGGEEKSSSEPNRCASSHTRCTTRKRMLA